jgi:polyphenol oxidase
MRGSLMNGDREGAGTRPERCDSQLEIEAPIELPGGGRALFTARSSGDLSTREGEQRGAPQARERLRARLGLRALAYSLQVHGALVRSVPESAGGRSADGLLPDRKPLVEADGHVTAIDGLGLIALSADCVPIALGSRGAIAMLHAGWRGLAAGVLERGIEALRAIDGDSEIVAVLGPGAGACCYEVGEEVHAVFGERHRAGRRLDLKALAGEQLRTAGVGEVRDLGLCTICDRRFFSHRREGSLAGRQAGVAWRT